VRLNIQNYIYKPHTQCELLLIFSMWDRVLQTFSLNPSCPRQCHIMQFFSTTLSGVTGDSDTCWKVNSLYWLTKSSYWLMESSYWLTKSSYWLMKSFLVCPIFWLLSLKLICKSWICYSFKASIHRITFSLPTSAISFSMLLFSYKMEFVSETK